MDLMGEGETVAMWRALDRTTWMNLSSGVVVHFTVRGSEVTEAEIWRGGDGWVRLRDEAARTLYEELTALVLNPR